jgi:hypothetical protein
MESLPDESREIVDRATRHLVDKLLQVKMRATTALEKPEN